jgi:hypothetical protein
VEWMKQHPYLTGVAVIVAVILYFVMRSHGTSSGGGGGADPNVLAAQVHQGDVQAAMDSQTRGYNASLEALALTTQRDVALAKMGADIAGSQTAAALQLGTLQSNNQLSSSNESTYAALEAANIAAAAQQHLADTQASTAVTTATIDANKSMDLETIQAQVKAEGFANALAMHKLDTVASVQINSQNTQRDVTLSHDALTQAVTLGAYKATTDAEQIQADLSISQDNNLTAITINNTNANRDKDIAKITADNAISLAGISAGIEQAKITATEDVYNHFLDTQSVDTLAAISAHAQEAGYQTSVEQSIINLISSGQINKGGEGGKNQVAVIAALTGQPTIGVAAEQTQPAWYTSFFNAIANVGAAVATHP